MMEKEYLYLLIDEEIYVSDKERIQVLKDKDQEAEVRSRGLETPINSTIKKVETVPIVFVHNSDNAQELELLNKIIVACRLDQKNFKILKMGENVMYRKAIIFTDASANYYQPQENDETITLYSKPLNILMNSKDEKGELWKALKGLVA